MPPGDETFSHLLTSLYDAVDDPSLWNPFLQQLAEITRAESAWLVWHDTDVHRISHSWEIDPELARLHSEYYHSVDPWALRGGNLPAGTVRTSQSLCSLEELRLTEVYNDVLVRFGIEHGLFAVVETITAARGGPLAFFVVHPLPRFRPPRKRFFVFSLGT
jgi:hypothetical protein